MCKHPNEGLATVPIGVPIRGIQEGPSYAGIKINHVIDHTYDDVVTFHEMTGYFKYAGTVDGNYWDRAKNLRILYV